MVTWNTRALTASAVHQLRKAATQARWRLFVHDNASADGTADAVRAAAPEAVIVRSPVNLGFGRAVNVATARGRAPWLLLLNSDAWPDHGALDALVAAAERHPAAAVVAPLLLRPDGTPEHSVHALPSLTVAMAGAVGTRWVPSQLAQKLLLNGAWDHDRERPVGWAVGAAWLMRRSAWQRLGGFDERYFMYGEDVQWCARANRAGYEVWFTPTAVVRHVGNASGAAGYGTRRPAAALHNVYRFYREEHGRFPTTLYRFLNVAGARRQQLRHALHGRRDVAAFWSGQAAAHRAAGRGPEPLPGRPA